MHKRFLKNRLVDRRLVAFRYLSPQHVPGLQVGVRLQVVRGGGCVRGHVRIRLLADRVLERLLHACHLVTHGFANDLAVRVQR